MKGTAKLLWKPLLAVSLPMDPVTEDFQWDRVQLPVYASPKLDGYRAMVQGGVLVSRNGLPVKNKELQARYGRKEYEGLDGELVDGKPTAPDVFNRTSRVVSKADADATVTYLYVIDQYGVVCSEDCGAAFGKRHECIQAALRREPGVEVIEQKLIKTVEALKAYEAKCLRQGYEGAMLRRADQGPYPQKPGKENRSTLNEHYLVRLKRFEYAEAAIVAVHPLRHNANEERTAGGRRSSKKAGIVVDKKLIGSAALRDLKTGVLFDTNVNGDALRAWPGWKDKAKWEGVTVRYKWQACGTKDKPRINSCTFEELV